MVRRLPRAPGGTTNEQRAIEFFQTSRMFLNRRSPIHTTDRSEPGAGANSTRATSSNGRAACGGRGVTEITSMRTSSLAPGAVDASDAAAAKITAPKAASRLIMR
jgi:hypothetical protein